MQVRVGEGLTPSSHPRQATGAASLSSSFCSAQLELDKSTRSFYSVGPAPLPGGPVVSFSVLRQPSPVYFGAPGESPSLAPGANAGAVRYAQAACAPPGEELST